MMEQWTNCSVVDTNHKHRNTHTATNINTQNSQHWLTLLFKIRNNGHNPNAERLITSKFFFLLHKSTTRRSLTSERERTLPCGENSLPAAEGQRDQRRATMGLLSPETKGKKVIPESRKAAQTLKCRPPADCSGQNTARLLTSVAFITFTAVYFLVFATVNQRSCSTTTTAALRNSLTTSVARLGSFHIPLA